MVQIAFAVVGAAIAGFAEAGAVGATVLSIASAAATGFAIGSMVGQILFPTKSPSQLTEGSRLGDLTVTSASYGAIQPIGYGAVRVSGNVIWALDVHEVRTETTTGGGGKK